jgi:tetratricopeptide (TPR) repeat protein
MQTLAEPEPTAATNSPESRLSELVTLVQPPQPSSSDTLVPEAGQGQPAAAPQAHHQVGRFVIRARLGEGAFGIVYRAYDPLLDREVALKVAKAGTLGTPQRVERFLREARSAARLRHPNIVPLFETGHAGGDYYIASALIPGQTLEEATRTRRLPTTRVAQIVRQLAEALAYAHGEGIVHRDVKPANVMLDERGQPLLMDFGLAARQRAGPQSEERTGSENGAASQAPAERLTQDGTVMGTPLYMAPEAASGHNSKVGPASDQYSLGILLYELLCGQAPFSGSIEKLLSQHQEEAIPSPRRHDPAVSRDLEAICLKCLEKDPSQRYPGCQALADDLRRWLEGEPVHARRPGMGERLYRWCRREPRLALASAVAVLALVGVAVVMALSARTQADLRWQAEAQADRARRQQQRADQNAEKARQQSQHAAAAARKARAESDRATAEAQRARKAAEFLSDLFRVYDPAGFSGTPLRSTHEKGQKLTARQILDKGARQIRTSFKDDPLGRAGLLDTIGDVYRSLGLFKEARPLLEEALALRRQHLRADHPDMATSLFHLGWWHVDMGDVVKAEKLYRQALDLRTQWLRQAKADAERRQAALSVAECKLNLGWALAMTAEPEAEPLFRDVLAVREKYLGPKHEDVAIAKAGLAAVLLDNGKWVEAARLALESMQFALQAGGTDAKSALAAAGYFQRGMFLRLAKQHRAAEQALRKSLELTQRLGGTDHPYNCLILHALGGVLAEEGKGAAAEKEWRACLDLVRKTVGMAHPRALIPVHDLAELLAQTRRPAEGAALYRELLQAQKDRFGGNCPWRLKALLEAAEFEVRCGDVGRGRDLSRAALALPTGRALDRVETLVLLNALGRSFIRRGLFADAGPPLRLALPRAKDQKGEPAWLRPALEVHLGQVEWAAGHLPEAETLLRSALAGFSKSGQNRNDWRLARRLSAGILAERGKYAEAAALLEQPATPPSGPPKPGRNEQIDDHSCLARLYRAAGDADGYRRVATELRQLIGKSSQPGELVALARVQALARAATAQPEFAESVAILEGVVKRSSTYHLGPQTLAWCLIRVGKPAEAEPHLKALASLPGGKDNPFDDLLRAWAAHRKEPTEATTAALTQVRGRLERYLGSSPAACQERLNRGWEALLELRLLAEQARLADNQK